MVDGQVDLIARLKRAAPVTATVWNRLYQRGTRSPFVMNGIRPILEGSVIAGPAVTVAFKPATEIAIDITEEERRKSAIFQACDATKPGDVVVLAALGDPSGIVGDCIAFGFKTKGADGIVIDGGVRDTHIIRHVYKYPVFAKNATPLAGQVFSTEFNVPVSCGGVMVKPGDVVVGDEDGVVVVPAHLLEEVVEYAEQEVKKEEAVRESIREEIPRGANLGELYHPRPR